MTAAPPPVGAFLATVTPPERIPSLAAQAEGLGYREVWVAEDYFYYGGFTTAALALQATKGVQVGVGIVSSVVRHPAVTAMEIATLARTYPGRLIVGVGHGLPAWVEQMGLTTKSPLAALDEAVTNIRRLLASETVELEGNEFTFRSVALAHPPQSQVPLLTGVLGPKSLQLSGRIADGTVMSVIAGTKYLEAASAHIKEGMARSGRTQHLLPTFALFSIDRDAKIAKAAVRPMLAFYLVALGPTNPLTAPFGYNEQLAELMSRGGADLVAKEMPDEWVDELAVAGDPDQVVARINALLAAGATSVVLSPADQERAAEELRLAASSVLPNITT